jgi:hypothetical protein
MSEPITTLEFADKAVCCQFMIPVRDFEIVGVGQQ